MKAAASFETCEPDYRAMWLRIAWHRNQNLEVFGSLQHVVAASREDFQ